jgi:hypothetical protein
MQKILATLHIISPLFFIAMIVAVLKNWGTQPITSPTNIAAIVVSSVVFTLVFRPPGGLRDYVRAYWK